mmetsp:Transcript_46660/g.117369  ORF Transcript_46660/g.117369 Transcript_46660/m.117369 type:complete len:115 (-) Transcript_46660:2-346(-)
MPHRWPDFVQCIVLASVARVFRGCVAVCLMTPIIGDWLKGLLAGVHVNAFSLAVLLLPYVTSTCNTSVASGSRWTKLICLPQKPECLGADNHVEAWGYRSPEQDFAQAVRRQKI